MRVVSWFSCGAASAVATKLALSYGPVTIAYCEVEEEHPDNKRFLQDCEKWFGQEIIILGNDNYKRSIYEVFKKTNYIAGPYGARCTLELKKKVREEFELPTDKQILGYTAEEVNRFDRFIDANNEIDLWPILIEKNLSKKDCLAIVSRAGIKLPVMYSLGYKNNNCRGCCKSSSPAYWKMIQRDFPEYYDKMHNEEKRLGVKICVIQENGVRRRISLDEIPDRIKPKDNSIDVQCGIFCQYTEKKIKGEFPINI